MSFVDEVRIKVKAGDGGKGCFSLYFNRRTGKNYPDGGDGGKGGDVIIFCDPNIWDLTHLKYKKTFKAENGAHGSSNKKKGKNGQDVIIKVPPGTIVKDETGMVIKDLVFGGDKFLVARGGRGGRGNAYTKAEPLLPESGEEKHLFLELKLLAHVGLVGYPNAGKTTLLNALCEAKGKVAEYPFTTLEPALGVIWDEDTAIKIADIPGLIQGAHQGKGLGDRFLRHIHRTKLLVFLLGLSNNDMEPWQAFKLLHRELKRYDPTLIKKDSIIVPNKIDLPEAKEKLKILIRELKGEKIIPISARTKTGLEELKREIISYFRKHV